MATEAVNGMEYNQFSQPVELAASTPNHAASASQGSNSAPAPKPDPQEIGWYFVEQYYTTLSKSPDKIHLFYNKKSQLITGTEAEKVLPSVGSKAISEKIKSLDISDCKIRVLNVDCQASFENIVVQVIGEMSNKNQPHHKFVQTFILATQPNGYFVLNDIFRYLNDDDDEIVEDVPVQEEIASEAVEQPVPTPAAAAEPEVVDTPVAADKVDEKLEAEVEAQTEEPEAPVEEVNGLQESVADTSENTEPEAQPEPEVEAEPQPEPLPAVEEPAPVEEQPEEPEPEPASAATETETEPEPEQEQEQTQSQSPAQANPETTGPPARKTWASMVGTKAPAIPALPQTQAPTTTSTTAPTQSKPRSVSTTQANKSTPSESAADSAATPTSQQSNGWQEAGKKTKQQPKAPEGIVHAYIKNVNDKIDARVLREVLEKFGTLKYYDVSRPKQCAFVEFNEPSAYAAAVAENPHTVGTETINVEERRPRPGTTGTFAANTQRGGAFPARGRGAPQQRTGSQGSGFTPREGAARGNFQGQRGGKPAGAARGRGQAQAA